jgi:hypothetical protein
MVTERGGYFSGPALTSETAGSASGGVTGGFDHFYFEPARELFCNGG